MAVFGATPLASGRLCVSILAPDAPRIPRIFAYVSWWTLTYPYSYTPPYNETRTSTSGLSNAGKLVANKGSRPTATPVSASSCATTKQIGARFVSAEGSRITIWICGRPSRCVGKYPWCMRSVRREKKKNTTRKRRETHK